MLNRYATMCLALRMEFGPLSLELYVLIMTEEMDLISERGIAAHYSGKVYVNGVVGIPNCNSSGGKTMYLNNIGWLNAIREWQEEFVGNMSSREFFDTIVKDLLGSRVFVFTPRGEIKNLPNGATVTDYAYMIHTEIGNKMMAAEGLSSKSAFQRHKQWLQHAKTRSARHKIIKQFVAESEGDSEVKEAVNHSKGAKHTWEKILRNVVHIASAKTSSEDIFQLENGSIQMPRINGKHSKNMLNVSLTAKGEVLSQGNGVAKMILANIPLYREVLPGLEVWQASKIIAWHNLDGNSIQWLSIVCLDRRGMMADITTALAAEGITICSCAAEIDRKKGMGVMLFHVEAKFDNLASACSKVDLILGVLGWSTRCSWLSSRKPTATRVLA